jgi:hypothetical protein
MGENVSYAFISFSTRIFQQAETGYRPWFHVGYEMTEVSLGFIFKTSLASPVKNAIAFYIFSPSALISSTVILKVGVNNKLSKK